MFHEPCLTLNTITSSCVVEEVHNKIPQELASILQSFCSLLFNERYTRERYSQTRTAVVVACVTSPLTRPAPLSDVVSPASQDCQQVTPPVLSGPATPAVIGASLRASGSSL